jgi:hypothetical protein
MGVATCRNCGETIMTPAMETYYVHTRTGMAQCGIRYATPVNPTADETKDPDTWTRLDLDAFWEGLNGLEPIGAMSEISASDASDVMPTNQCDHIKYELFDGVDWQVFPFCPKCGEKI